MMLRSDKQNDIKSNGIKIMTETITRYELGSLLGEAKKSNHTFTCEFIKRSTGKNRVMRAYWRRKNDQAVAGGIWANNNAGKPTDHKLILVRDAELVDQAAREIKENNLSETDSVRLMRKTWRSIPFDAIHTLKYSGKVYNIN